MPFLRRIFRRTGPLLILAGLSVVSSYWHGHLSEAQENNFRQHSRQPRSYPPSIRERTTGIPDRSSEELFEWNDPSTTAPIVPHCEGHDCKDAPGRIQPYPVVLQSVSPSTLDEDADGTKQVETAKALHADAQVVIDSADPPQTPERETKDRHDEPEPKKDSTDHPESRQKETAPKPVHEADETKPEDGSCQSLPGGENVLVVIKTGGTEVYSRLAIQLLTISSCASNLLIFSDLEQDIGEFHIHDALDEIGEEYKNTAPEFELYNDLKHHHAQHETFSTLSTTKGWELDKWKNIPMLHKSYQKYPDMDWFVFMDADTYLSWANLLELLGRLDPNDPLYFGSIWWYGDFGFAQGGAGYVVSNAAAKKFEEVRDAEHIAAWEADISQNCCGDVAVAMALADASVNLTQAYPMMQCDPPNVLEWSERVWCTPVISWHHVTPQDVDALWHFEKQWMEDLGRDEKGELLPYLYRDAFEHFVQPRLRSELRNWDNLSHDRTFKKPNHVRPQEEDERDSRTNEEKWMEWAEWTDFQKKAVQSADDCRAVCQADKGCMQWSWRPGTCKHSWNVRIGHSVESTEESVSGWMVERIGEFKDRLRDCVPVWDFNT